VKRKGRKVLKKLFAIFAVLGVLCDTKTKIYNPILKNKNHLLKPKIEYK
jgi:hypothetical protein